MTQGKDKGKEKQLGRRRSLVSGGGKLFSRKSRTFTGKKTGENDVDQINEGQGEKRKPAVTSAQSDRVGEQSEQEATNATAPAAERVDESEADILQPSQEQVVSETPEAETSTRTPTSPKPESKLRSWFRGRFPRRFSKPPPAEEQSAYSVKQGNSAGTEEGVAAADNSPPAAPLTSNPVTETDFAPATASGAANPPDEEDAGNEEATRQWSSSSEHSHDENGRWSSSFSGDSSNRRRRLRLSLRDMILRKPTTDIGSAGESPLASPVATATPSFSNKTIGTTAMSRPAPARLNTMERDELSDNFAEETLPPPPSLLAERRSISSSARDSKFSEDL